MRFDLCTINWQTISAICSSLTLIGAYLYPGFRDRWKVEIGIMTFRKETEKIELSIIIKNRSNKNIEITNWSIEYRNDPDHALDLYFPENENGIFEVVRKNRSCTLKADVDIKKLKNIKNVIILEASGKRFKIKNKYLKNSINKYN